MYNCLFCFVLFICQFLICMDLNFDSHVQRLPSRNCNCNHGQFMLDLVITAVSFKIESFAKQEDISFNTLLSNIKTKLPNDLLNDFAIEITMKNDHDRKNYVIDDKSLLLAFNESTHDHQCVLNAIATAHVVSNQTLMKNFGFKQCPNGQDLIRVRCPLNTCKNKPDFCWICTKIWKGSGHAVCGNQGCPSK